MASQLFEFTSLNTEVQGKIIEYIMSSENPFQTSLLYLPKEEEKVVDTERRLSEFRTFEEKELFQYCEILVEELNKKQDLLTFKLVPNDVTHIKYRKGGFFKSHQDYLSMTTNTLLEYTMIMCLNADCEGGQTAFHINPYFTHTSQCSVTPGGVVVFRKDVYHEGLKVKSGHKEIMTLNLWAIPRKQGKIIAITCSDSETDKDCPIVLGQDQVCRFDNYFKSMLEFAAASGSKSGTELSNDIYTTKVCHTKDEMNIVYRVLTGQRVSSVDFDKYREVLDYYAINCWILLMILKDIYQIKNTLIL